MYEDENDDEDVDEDEDKYRECLNIFLTDGMLCVGISLGKSPCHVSVKYLVE